MTTEDTHCSCLACDPVSGEIGRPCTKDRGATEGRCTILSVDANDPDVFDLGFRSGRLKGFSEGVAYARAELTQDMDASRKLSIVGGVDYPDNANGS